MKTKALSLAAALAIAASPAFAASIGDGIERAELGAAIAERWSNDIERTYQLSPERWRDEMAPVFAMASLEELRMANTAGDLQSMNSMLLGDLAPPAPTSAEAAAEAAPKALGDASSDLVYVPVVPCRILDTRLAVGQIPANTVRGVDVTAVSNYAFQGGANTNCGIGAAPSFAAVAVNLTVVTPQGAGYLTAFPTGTTQPTAATLNYAGNDIVNSLAIVRLDQGPAAYEMDVYSYASTHLVGDVVGYFINPTATALQCQTTQTSYPIAAGASFNGGSPACAAGYTRTGGGCYSSSYNGRVVSTYPNGPSFYCSWVNEGSGSMNGIAMADCCRVPGR